jgi:hypothetical protein
VTTSRRNVETCPAASAAGRCYGTRAGVPRLSIYCTSLPYPASNSYLRSPPVPQPSLVACCDVDHWGAQRVSLMPHTSFHSFNTFNTFFSYGIIVSPSLSEPSKRARGRRVSKGLVIDLLGSCGCIPTRILDILLLIAHEVPPLESILQHGAGSTLDGARTSLPTL